MATDNFRFDITVVLNTWTRRLRRQRADDRLLLRLAQAKGRLEQHHGSMAPLPKKTAHDANRIHCHQHGCSGSCPRLHLLRAFQPGSHLPSPTCRVCGQHYPKPPQGELLAWQRRREDADQQIFDRAAAATRGKQQQRRHAQDGKHNNNSSPIEQNLKAELAKIKKELALTKKEQNKPTAKATMEAEEHDQEVVDAEEELALWTQEEADCKQLLARPGLSAVSRDAYQAKLAKASSIRSALEQKRDEAKPYSSKVQRAEAEEQKAKKQLGKVEVKLEAAYESLNKQMQAVAKLKDEKQQCEQAVAEATKQVACYRNSQQQEDASPQMDDLTKLQVLMQHIQAAMQTQMQQELPQQIFETAYQTLQAACKPPPAPPADRQPAQPDAAAASTSATTSAAAPAAQAMDVEEQERAEEHKKAAAAAAATDQSTPDLRKVDLDEWMQRQPQEPSEKEGPEREAFKKAREEWVASAFPAAKKLRHTSG